MYEHVDISIRPTDVNVCTDTTFFFFFSAAIDPGVSSDANLKLMKREGEEEKKKGEKHLGKNRMCISSTHEIFH